MAFLMPSPPLPFLLDSLLASSWAWVAISFATIATLFSALSGIPFYTRLRQGVLLHSSSRVCSAETEVVFSDISPALPQSSGRHCTSCSGRPDLKSLLYADDHDYSVVAESGPFFSVKSREFVVGALQTAVLLDRYDVLDETSKHSLTISQSPQAIGCALVLDDVQRRKDKESTKGLEGELGSKRHAYVSDDLSAWNYASKTLWNGQSSSLCTPPSFEMQFGWHELLKEKLGLSWQVRTEDFFVEHACNTGNQSSVRALNVDDFDGYACLVKVNGDLSLWDTINRACINKACCKGGVISAISRKMESRFAVAGGSDSLSVWDFRCPVLMPLFRMTADWQSHQILHFDDYEVFIHQPQSYQQLYDMRKPQSGILSSMPAASVMGESSLGERANQTFTMWEKLTFSDEEESCDDPVVGHNGASHEKNYSFTMRCVTMVRSLSS